MNLDSFYSFKNGANIPLVNGVCYFHLDPSLLPNKDQGIEQISKHYSLSHFHNLLIQCKMGFIINRYEAWRVSN